MTPKFQSIVKRWAIPVAAILLPGGFVVLACGWVTKSLLAKKRSEFEEPIISVAVVPLVMSGPIAKAVLPEELRGAAQ